MALETHEYPNSAVTDTVTLRDGMDSAVAPRLADDGVRFPRTAQTNRLSSTWLICSAVAPRLGLRLGSRYAGGSETHQD